MNNDSAVMTDAEFQAIRRLAYRSCGLDLSPEKRNLVASRLSSITRRFGFDSFGAYHRHILSDRSGDCLIEFIDTLTTNHTSFLRDPEHFSVLGPALARAKASQSALRVWSAACSTGEEPYSAAMALKDREAIESSAQGWSILASDISIRALTIAHRAAYPDAQLTKIPSRWRNLYFDRGCGPWAGWLRLKKPLQNRVRFERLNLLNDFSGFGSFDLIFCRNVMIYFDRATRENLVERLADRLVPGGNLLIGFSESLMDIGTTLQLVSPGIYLRP